MRGNANLDFVVHKRYHLFIGGNMSDYKDGFDDGYRFGREEIIEKLREIDISDIDSWLMDRLADMIEGGDI